MTHSIEHAGHLIDWQLHEPDSFSSNQAVYDQGGIIGFTEGRRPESMIRGCCVHCSYTWTVLMTDREIQAVRGLWHSQRGPALAGYLLGYIKQSCQEVRDLRLCREVMES